MVRWVRRVACGLGVVLAVAAMQYGWAWLSLDRSATARALLQVNSDVRDQMGLKGVERWSGGTE